MPASCATHCWSPTAHILHMSERVFSQLTLLSAVKLHFISLTTTAVQLPFYSTLAVQSCPRHLCMGVTMVPLEYGIPHAGPLLSVWHKWIPSLMSKGILFQTSHTPLCLEYRLIFGQDQPGGPRKVLVAPVPPNNT